MHKNKLVIVDDINQQNQIGNRLNNEERRIGFLL